MQWKVMIDKSNDYDNGQVGYDDENSKLSAI